MSLLSNIITKTNCFRAFSNFLGQYFGKNSHSGKQVYFADSQNTCYSDVWGGLTSMHRTYVRTVSCCLICSTGLNCYWAVWEEQHALTVNSISVQTSQEIECTKTKEQLRAYCPNQEQLEFIWTEGCSGRSSNPGLALAILVL